MNSFRNFESCKVKQSPISTQKVSSSASVIISSSTADNLFVKTQDIYIYIMIDYPVKFTWTPSVSCNSTMDITPENEYSFSLARRDTLEPLHLLKSATDIILYNDYSCCPPRRRRDRPLHPLREQPSTSRSSKSFKESESVVTSGSIMLQPITPIVKDESHGESFLPIWGVENKSKSGSVKKKQRSLEVIPSCLLPSLKSKKRATSMQYSKQQPFWGNMESCRLGAGHNQY